LDKFRRLSLENKLLKRNELTNLLDRDVEEAGGS
jgi:hypothetical protein